MRLQGVSSIFHLRCESQHAVAAFATLIELIVPSLFCRIVCIIAKWAADAFGKESLYDELIKINHYPHFDQRHDNVYNETADDLIDKSRDLCVIPLLNNTVASLQALLHATTFSGFPVVTSLSEMHIVGFMSRSNMEAVLQQALEEWVSVLF